MKQNILIAGVDEVGRGPLAGPVVAAAVILNPEIIIEGVKDSKKLSEKKREELFSIIQEKSIAWAVGRAEVYEIDTMNIFHASLLAMERAVKKLPVAPSEALFDGKHCPKLTCVTKAIVKGDETVAAISAASIIAKVTRDREMIVYDSYYPQYGFAAHKGYGTKQHLTALEKYGATPLHRKSFGPVATLFP